MISHFSVILYDFHVNTFNFFIFNNLKICLLLDCLFHVFYVYVEPAI